MVARHAACDGQPQQRPAHEQLRGHQVRVDARSEHHQVEADQTHVVRERHPRQANVVLVEAAAWFTDWLWAIRLACVSTTPFGSLVEPEENWMKATLSGRAR